MTDTSTLQSVLSKTGDIVEGVAPEQAALPTPCLDFTVGKLVDHIVAWMRIFANGAAGIRSRQTPTATRRSIQPATSGRPQRKQWRVSKSCRTTPRSASAPVRCRRRRALQ